MQFLNVLRLCIIMHLKNCLYNIDLIFEFEFLSIFKIISDFNTHTHFFSLSLSHLIIWFTDLSFLDINDDQERQPLNKEDCKGK